MLKAVTWNKNGDHPGDECLMSWHADGNHFLSEGKVVRYYRDPRKGAFQMCAHCDTFLKDHGWIDQGEHSTVVCPGDVVITAHDGRHYAMKPRVYESLVSAIRVLWREYRDDEHREHFSDDEWETYKTLFKRGVNFPDWMETR